MAVTINLEDFFASLKLQLDAIKGAIQDAGFNGAVTSPGDASADENKEEINKRVGALADFFKNHPDSDIHSTKFSVDLSVKPNDTLNWEGIDPDKQPLIQRQMAAFQRTYILTDNAETS